MSAADVEFSAPDGTLRVDLTAKTYSSPLQPAEVRVALPYNSPASTLTYQVSAQSSSGSGTDMPGLDDILARLRQVETDVGTMRVEVGKAVQRLDTMPTREQLWKALALGGVSVIGALLGVAWWLVQTYLSPILGKLPG